MSATTPPTPPVAPLVPSPPARSQPGRWHRGVAWLRLKLIEPEPPLTVVEVRTRSVGVVRFVHESGRLTLAAASSLVLPEGALSLSMTQPNILDTAAYAKTLQSALERAGVLSGARVGMVLPDPVARVALLPAAEVFSRGRREAEEMVRFRMRKVVPFEIRDVRIVYRPLGVGQDAQVLVAVMSRPVLLGYEEVFRSIGLTPGLVELTGLALQACVEGRRAPANRLLVNWDEGYVSILMSREGVPTLTRTLVGEAATTADNVVREVASTALYLREKLGGALDEALLRSAVLPAPEAVAMLREPLGLTPEILDLAAGANGSDRASPFHALAGAMASVLTRAA